MVCVTTFNQSRWKIPHQPSSNTERFCKTHRLDTIVPAGPRTTYTHTHATIVNPGIKYQPRVFGKHACRQARARVDNIIGIGGARSCRKVGGGRERLENNEYFGVHYQPFGRRLCNRLTPYTWRCVAVVCVCVRAHVFAMGISHDACTHKNVFFWLVLFSVCGFLLPDNRKQRTTHIHTAAHCASKTIALLVFGVHWRS